MKSTEHEEGSAGGATTDSPHPMVRTPRTASLAAGSIIGQSVSAWLGIIPICLSATIVFGIPIAALQAWFDVSFPEEPKPGLADVLNRFVDFFFSMFTAQVHVGCVAYATVQYMRQESATAGVAIQRTIMRFFPLIITALLLSTICALGFMILFIPGIILSCIFAVSTVVTMCEGSFGFAALRRSAYLTKGHRWLIFVTSLLVGIVIMAVATMTGFAMGYAFSDLNTFILNLIVYTIVGFVGSVTSAMNAVVYVTLRRQKEGIEVDEVAKVFA